MQRWLFFFCKMGKVTKTKVNKNINANLYPLKIYLLRSTSLLSTSFSPYSCLPYLLSASGLGVQHRGLFVSLLSLLCLQKSPVLCIGEEQPKNCFTELQVLKGHFDIVRFLVQIDDFR